MEPATLPPKGARARAKIIPWDDQAAKVAVPPKIAASMIAIISVSYFLKQPSAISRSLKASRTRCCRSVSGKSADDS